MPLSADIGRPIIHRCLLGKSRFYLHDINTTEAGLGWHGSKHQINDTNLPPGGKMGCAVECGSRINSLSQCAFLHQSGASAGDGQKYFLFLSQKP